MYAYFLKVKDINKRKLKKQLKMAQNISFNQNEKRPFQIVSQIYYNLNANEDFVMFVTSKFITCFVDTHLHAFSFTFFGNKIPINCLFTKGK